VTKKGEAESGVGADAVESFFRQVGDLSDRVGAQVRQLAGLKELCETDCGSGPTGKVVVSATLKYDHCSGKADGQTSVVAASAAAT
jgi:hypothetical protein